jgi:hypothetical protein
MEERSTFRHAKWKRGPSQFPANQIFHSVAVDQDLLGRLAEDIAQFKKDGAFASGGEKRNQQRGRE